MTTPAPSALAVIRPGDTLLLVSHRNLTQEEAQKVAAEFRSHIDPSVKLAIFDGAGDCTVSTSPHQENLS